MKTRWNVVMMVVLLLSGTALQARLNVVGTLPDFAAIAREIGGDHVKATALAKGSEDPHFVDARPTLIRVLNKADVLIEGGADLEIGWLPPLVENARNRRILPGQPGRVDASRGIQLMDIPTTPVDRSQGDVHGRGNPHYSLDPANGKIIAAQLADVFSRLEPKHAADFRANLKKFQAKIDAKLAEWGKAMAPYKGVQILTYHSSFNYLARRFGLVVAGQLEPKPGIEPSPRHISSLIPFAREKKVRLVVAANYRPRRTPTYVADSLNASLVILPDKVDGNRQSRDYFQLFDFAVNEMVKGLEKAR